MKKTLILPVLFLLLLRAMGQETVITVSFARNSDSVKVNGQVYSNSEEIALDLPVSTILVCKTITDADAKFKLTISSGRSFPMTYDQDEYKSHGDQMKYQIPDLTRKYQLSLMMGQKSTKIQIGFRDGTSQNTAPSGSGDKNQTSSPGTQKPPGTREPYIPGIPYYDAIALASPANLDYYDLITIFRHYFNKPLYPAPALVSRIRDTVKNQYLYHSLDTAVIFSKMKPPAAGLAESESLLGGSKALSVPGIGGLDITNIADGFAKFIVKRAKTELNIAFFERFRELISRPEYKDMQTLFPQTYRSLMVIGEEIYNYEAYIQALRESFEKDLASLLTTMPDVIENHPEFFSNQPELKAMVESAFYIGQQFQDRQNPGDIIANYPDDLWKDCNPNYYASFRTLKLLSASLRSRDAKESYWISPDEMKMLAANPRAMKIYLGLMIESARNDKITFRIKGKADSLADIINRSWSLVGNDLPKYTEFVKDFAQKSSVVAKKINGLKKTGSDSLLLENYYSFFSSVIDLLKFTAKVEDLPHFPKMGLKEKTGIYTDAAQTTADIVIDVNRRNYSSAVVNLFHLYTMVFSDQNTDKELADMRMKEGSQAKNYEQAVKTLKSDQKQLKKEKDPARKIILNGKIRDFETMMDTTYADYLQYLRLEKIREVLNAIYKYGTFMATVVAAKTSDEVADAIEAAALPAGSSRIKKETKVNVSLNSYLGLYMGYEQIRSFDTSGFKLNSYGVTAPIGVAVSRGHSVFFIPTGNAGWSTSAFVSFVDIGAIAAFRVKDSTTSQIPTIQLQDIISPGVFLSIGFPKFPISINLGVQMGPNLRSVNYEGNDYSNNIYLRYSASLVVDIPIFNFYTKPRE